MGTINKKVREFTHEGAPAKNIDFVSQLERSVMSCMLWEDTFYEDGKLIADRISELCLKVPAADLSRIAIQAKEDMRIRHVPLLMAYNLTLTKDGLKHFGETAAKVITRADDITEFMAIYWREKKHPLAKQVKKHLGLAFAKFDEYQLQKYNGGSKAIKLKDVIKLVRPKPENETQAALWGRLVKGELATPDTWEVAISATKDKKSEWTRLLSESKLGGLAMLRNVRNMVQAGVDRDLIQKGIENIKPGKLLPINFIASANHNPQFEPALEMKFFDSFSEETKKGKTVFLIDVSGSMDEKLSFRSEMRRLDVACSLAMIGREMFSDVRVFTFSETLAEVPARRGFALRDAITRSQPHQGTRLGTAVSELTSRIEFDRLIVLTDEQSHDRVPDVNGGYMINVASNKNGVGYGAWLHIDGWSDKVLSYLVKYEAQK